VKRGAFFRETRRECARFFIRLQHGIPPQSLPTSCPSAAEAISQ
jgi:hypothetical protein